MRPCSVGAAWLATIALTACAGSPTEPGEGGDDLPPGVNNTTTFRGTIAGGDGRSGIVEITIQTSLSGASSASPITSLHTAPSDVSGSLTLAMSGQLVSLAGHHEHSTNGVTLSGGGFMLNGTVRPDGILEGSYSAPGGGGGFSMLNNTTSFVTAYCGTFSAPEPDDHGVWNVQLPSSGGSMSGVAIQDGRNDPAGPPMSPGDPDIIYIRGNAGGGMVTFSLSDGGNGRGGLSGQVVSGIWTDVSGESGTFSGSTVGCQ